MNGRRYAVYDVFARTPLAGNPLAVVFDGDELEDRRMQAIAAEFALSETVFVQPPTDSRHMARLRIFTPARELPFAGHPTVGTAVALFEARGREGAAGIMVLEENVGPVRCVVSKTDADVFAEFDLPRRSEPFAFDVAEEAVVAALGLEPGDVGFENHVVSGWSAGVPFALVPVASLDAARRIRPDPRLWRELVGDREGAAGPAIYAYCRGGVDPDTAFHARMFAPDMGIGEDPATGAAVAALSGAIVHFDRPVDGPQRCWIEQGVEMGRPSRIRLELDIHAGAPTSARIGGHAVKVAEGTLYL
ncbi:MAG: PhzF family phenazine biosynthesis protein [Rhizobiaceae bacterium]|nr:PhzF family phenazine biosynthesis protein [Rhizobiaceae bacterium]